MKKKLLAWLLCAVMIAAMLPGPSARAAKTGAAVAEKASDGGSKNSLSPFNSGDYGRLPLLFIPNAGQLDAHVFFTVRGADKTVSFTEEGLNFDLSGQSNKLSQEHWALKLSFIGANRVVPETLEASETVISYFVGAPERWHTGLRASSKIIYRDLWPGIDLVFSGVRDRLKYEFIVRPGADPNLIRLAYSGADSVAVDKKGNLLVSTPVCALTDDKPLAFQDGGRSPVESDYNIEGDEAGVYTYGFVLGPYDADKTIIIDPALLLYSGLIGGISADEASGVAIDDSGAAYIVGNASNPTDFPVNVGPFVSAGGSGDAFVAKLNATGTGLEYCGFIGGSNLDDATHVAVDASGCAVIGGSTYSSDFPVASAGWTGASTMKGLSDGFVAKISADGTGLLCCGYLGGAGNENISAIALDGAGNICATGSTTSSDFPAASAGWTGAASLQGINDAFVAEIVYDGSALQWSGYLGGTGRDSGMGLAVDATGFYITGQTLSPDYPVVNAAWTGATALKGSRDAFVTKIAPDGSGITYSGYFGGSLDDDAYAIALDASGCACLTGETNSTDLPITAADWNGATALGGSKDAFVAKVNAGGTDLDCCGYLGGTDWDTGYGIAVDASGAVIVAGDTRSADFPATGALWQDSTTLRGNRDAFVTKINAAGTALEYSGFLGGSDFDYANCIATDGSGAAYVAGYASSADFPHVITGWTGASANQGGSDAFVAKIAQADTPSVVTGKILDLTATGALIWGEVTDDGGKDVTARGVVYGLSPDPTTVTGTTVQAAAAGTGKFSAALTGLTANTTYYVRAYAINAADTSYGDCRRFTTPVSVTTMTTAASESMLAPVMVDETKNKIYTGSLWNNKIYIFDGSTDTLSGSISAGCRDYTLAVNKKTNKIYSASGTSLFIIDGATNAVKTITLGTGAYALAVNETTNKIYVTSENMTSPLYVIDGAADTLEATVVTGTKGCAVTVNETANEIYVADDMGGKVVVIDGNDNSVKSTVSVGTRPRDIAVNETTHTLYVVNWGNVVNNGTVSVIDCDDAYSVQTLAVGNKAYPYDAEVNETTNMVYVSMEAFDSVLVINGADNSIQTVSVGNLPHKVAVNEKTNKIYVANVSADEWSDAGYTVTEIDGATLEAVSFADANGPEQLALNTATNKIYVTNFDDATVTVITLASSVPTPDYVCEIVGGAQYETLDAAVAAVPPDTPTTIRLLTNIDRNSTLAINGSKKITLDLNSYNLNITVAAGAALEVSFGGSLTTAGAGTMNLSGVLYGIDANHGGQADITGSVIATGDTVHHSNGAGVNACDSSTSVTVHGNVTGDMGGVIAYSGAQIHVIGNVTAYNVAVNAASGGQISVSGDVSDIGVGVGVQATSATVTVGGNVIASGPGGLGILLSNAAAVTVEGDVTAVHQGVSASYQSTLHIGGSVTVTDAANGSGAVTATTSASVTVDGSVSARAYGAGAETSGVITIKGNISSYFCGINTGTGAEVFALGNIVADNTVGVGVNAYSTGEATIDGNIQAHKAMTFGESDGAQVIPSTKLGYLTYSDNAASPSFIWIKSATSVLPTITTNAVESSGVSQSSAAISGNVTSSGTAAVTERGFVYGTAAGPTTITGTKVTAALGTGTGPFSATLTGLAAGTTYHVRAYAISAAGTSYGEDRTFTTLSGGGGGVGGGGGSSSSGNSAASSGTQTYNADIKEGVVKTDTLPVKVDGASTGTADMDVSKTAKLFNAGNSSVVMPDIPGASAYRLAIPASALTADHQGSVLTLSTGFGSMTFPDNMLSSLTGMDGKTAGITIGQGDRSSLTDTEKAAIGNRPIIQLTLTLDGVQTEWNNPAAPVTVTIPYTPTAEELKNPESILVWYLDGSGKPVCVPNGHYDPATGTVTFNTTHFSRYAVGYNHVSFKDVASGAWYFKAVSFIAAREITSGTGRGKYSPDAKLTRAEFLVLLMRAYGIAPDTNPKDNFADAGNAYYTNYLAAAKRLGISAGVGNNMYRPGKEITRQEMFTLLYNALNVIGRLPQGNSGKTLSDFSDAGSIATWARDAMKRLVETGIVSGSGGKLFPTNNTTRAEMAQVLYSLLMKE